MTAPLVAALVLVAGTFGSGSGSVDGSVDVHGSVHGAVDAPVDVDAPVHAPAPAPGAAEGGDALAECKALAPFTDSCSFSITFLNDVKLEIPHDLVYSGTLSIKAAQGGVVVWNGTCIVPLGFFDTGVGGCLGEDKTVATGVPTNFTVYVGVYGVGTYGLRAYYS